MKELDHFQPQQRVMWKQSLSYDFSLRVLLPVIMIACLLNLQVPSVWLPFMSLQELPFDQHELLSQDGREGNHLVGICLFPLPHDVRVLMQ
jgi:hypothetical protein